MKDQNTDSKKHTGNPNFLVVEDDDFFQEVISEGLKHALPDAIASFCSSGANAIALLSSVSKPFQFAIVDLGLPDMDGVVLIERLLQLYSHMKIVVVSRSNTEERVIDAIRAGAQGYVLKGDANLTVSAAISQICSGLHPISPSIAVYFLKQIRGDTKTVTPTLLSISNRERQLLELFAAGKTYNEAAIDMNVALSTVQAHARNLYKKLGVRSNLQALSQAKKHGLI